MTEERITQTEDQLGNTHTTHVVHDDGDRSGGAGKWVFLIILALAVVVAVVLLSRPDASEIAANNAVTEAAGEVGEAAGQIGNAAEEAADAVTQGN